MVVDKPARVAVHRGWAKGGHDAFAAGTVRKRYLAITRGHPPEQVTIDHPIPSDEGAVRAPAVTELRPPAH